MTWCSMFFTRTADIDRSSCNVVCSTECVRTCGEAVATSQSVSHQRSYLCVDAVWFSPALGSVGTTAVRPAAPWTAHASRQGLGSPEPPLGRPTAAHSGQAREGLPFGGGQIYRRTKHLRVRSHSSRGASDAGGRPHHFIHLSQSVPPILPVFQNTLSKVDNVQLHAETDVLRQRSEDDVSPHGEVLHLGRRETCHQLHLETVMVQEECVQK